MKMKKRRYGYYLKFNNVEGTPVVSKYRSFKRAKKDQMALARIRVFSNIKKYQRTKKSKVPKGSKISKGVKRALKKYGWG